MPTNIQFGAVVVWDGWRFDDGDVAKKWLIVLGAKADKDMLLLLTTSQPPPVKTVIGCNERLGIYVIPAAKEGLPVETYVQLYRPQVVTVEAYSMAEKEGKVSVRNVLRKDVTAGIRNCLNRSPFAAPIWTDLAE